MHTHKDIARGGILITLWLHLFCLLARVTIADSRVVELLEKRGSPTDWSPGRFMSTISPLGLSA